MTLSIDLSPETEAKLREHAAASGKDVTTYAREAIEQKLAADDRNRTAPASPRHGDEEWFTGFREWVAAHPPRLLLADDSRDATYAHYRVFRPRLRNRVFPKVVEEADPF